MYCRANEIRLSNIYSREGKSQGNKANESKYIVQLLAATIYFEENFIYLFT